jgi:hypothetical protein
MVFILSQSRANNSLFVSIEWVNIYAFLSWQTFEDYTQLNNKRLIEVSRDSTEFGL